MKVIAGLIGMVFAPCMGKGFEYHIQINGEGGGKMKRAFLIPIGLSLIMFLPAQVYSYTIDDTTKIGVGYSHDTADNNRYITDYLGAEFDTAGIDVNFAGSIITIDLYTKFDGSFFASPVELALADLFFDTGSGWNFAVDMSTYFGGAGDLYSVESYKTSEDVLHNDATTASNWQYGRYYENTLDNVLVDGTGTDIGDVTFAARTGDANGYVYSMTFDTTSLGLTAGQDLGIYWATAYCANDLIIGSVAPVPEPATMLLFGTGLIGLAGLSLRRKK